MQYCSTAGCSTVTVTTRWPSPAQPSREIRWQTNLSPCTDWETETNYLFSASLETLSEFWERTYTATWHVGLSWWACAVECWLHCNCPYVIGMVVVWMSDDTAPHLPTPPVIRCHLYYSTDTGHCNAQSLSGKYFSGKYFLTELWCCGNTKQIMKQQY